MSRAVILRRIFSLVIALALVAAFVMLYGGAPPAYASGATTTKTQFCNNLGKKFQASSGAQMFCFGSQPNGPGPLARPGGRTFGTNVDAASPSEDISPSGVQSFGQSETSIAAVGHYVVEAWNDATSFFAPCGSPMNKEEGTGFGFSADGGASFTDLGGLPNNTCTASLYFGDPSVEAWSSGGKSYFYTSSLFDPLFSPSGPPADPRSHIAMTACAATGTGSSAVLSCSQPVIIASSSECLIQKGGTFCSFLDKDFMSIDPVRKLLYVSFTEFFFNPQTFAPTSVVELAVCDIGNGGLGGTPAAPVCANGGGGSAAHPRPPYLVVAPNDVHGCENEGAYPAVDSATGDVYVAYEHNWFTALFGPPGNPCQSIPVQNVVKFIPASCLTLPAASCSGPATSSAVNIASLQAAFIPGYNRFPMNDFPRIAVSDSFSTVSIVWNDARLHPAGDILMQSFSLVSLGAKTGSPVVLNRDSSGWHFLPGLRNSNQNGLLNVSWYSRKSANTALTDVTAAIEVNPLSAATPARNSRVTTATSDWNAVSSDIVPNFGDYTDNYTIATATAGFTGFRDFVAWSDGRLGDPQPFEASAPG